ncbi:hypothetical protein [Marinilactibacillus kalidii]|uniref:hypothetical protein n=1 Tax=Marinilactibacillus kalidii TaxID=2820274 RepID=UPI001ABE3E32|nr:hypothetical protein [Marinilactibacillus kalidii]
MWIILGIMAMIATFMNLYRYKAGKDYTLAMAAGLSFTALTLCAEYSLVFRWVKANDWTALADVVPTMEKLLWLLTIAAIFLNLLPIILEWKNKELPLHK